MMKNVVVGITLVLTLTMGCHQTNEVVEQQQPRISIEFSNLPRLAEGEGHYQLWAKFIIFNRPGQIESPLHDSTAVSLGEFNVSEDGEHIVAPDDTPMRLTIPADQNPQLIDDVIIALQQDEPGLAKTHHEEPGPTFLGGKVHGDSLIGIADLDISYSHALGSTFSNVLGKCTITAPTSPADSNSGVWFIEPGITASAGLRNLPTLPIGWRYEGWVGYPVIQIDPQKSLAFLYYSTGKFLRADSADFDGAGPGKGSGTGLNFPGQDFVNAYPFPGGPPPKPDLRFHTFMITIEPDPDNSPGPFSLTLLSTQPGPTALPQGQPIAMNNVSAASFPRARITIVRSGY